MKSGSKPSIFIWFFLCLLFASLSVASNPNPKSRYVNLFSFLPSPQAQSQATTTDSLTQKLPSLHSCLINAGVHPAALVQQDTGSQIYKRLNHQWNAYPEIKNPTAFLVVQTAADIQAAVRCGRQLKIRVVPKGGGHSFEKYSYGDANSLVLDLQLLDTVSINHVARTADVGPGVLLGPLAWKLYANESEHGIPSGMCPSVGISLALGGGFGNLPRYFGLTSDAIVELDLITASGEVLMVNEDRNPDLFWALRGGGGSASFGVVSRFKLKLSKAPDKIVYSLTFYNQSEFEPVFRVWQSLIANGDLPDTINSVLTVNKTHVTLEFVEVHKRPMEPPSLPVSSLIGGILRNFPTAGKISGSTDAVTYDEYLYKTVFPNPEFYNLRSPADLLTIHRGSFTPTFSKTKSFFSGPRQLTLDGAMSRFAQALRSMPEGGSLVMEAFGPGSVINSVGPNATAFVHRNSLYHATVGYTGGRPDYDTGGKQWQNSFYNTATRLLNHSESYQNYADADLEGRLEKYYGANLERLVAIKRAVDPLNYFRSPESISPALS